MKRKEAEGQSEEQREDIDCAEEGGCEGNKEKAPKAKGCCPLLLFRHWLQWFPKVCWTSTSFCVCVCVCLLQSFVIYFFQSILFVRNPGVWTIEDELEKALHLGGAISDENFGDLGKVPSVRFVCLYVCMCLCLCLLCVCVCVYRSLETLFPFLPVGVGTCGANGQGSPCSRTGAALTQTLC